MKKIVLSIVFICANLFAFGQVGENFPEVTVTDLNDKEEVIPKDTKGKFTLIGVAFSEDAQRDLYSWSEPVYNEFMNENNFASLVYDPHVKLILMFGGGNQLVYNKAKEQILEGTDESLRNNVVLYKGEVKTYRKSLKMKDRKIPYFFVLDKKGKIIYAASGKYNKKTLEEVGNLIEDE